MNKNATSTTNPTVKVIGVGCGGNNIVNHMSQSGFDSVSFVACDMEAKVLEKSAAATTPCKSARTDLEAATTLKKQTSLLKKTQMQ